MEKDKRAGRIKRKKRIRQKLQGTEQRPRLAVFRSLLHIYVQVIDDTKGHTLASSSTLEKELKAEVKGKKRMEAAKIVGASVAKKCKEIGITQIAFDRGDYKYHGRVKALAEAAREGGLEF